MERRKKKLSGHGDDGGGGGRASRGGKSGGRGRGGGGSSTRVVMSWEDAQHDGDDDEAEERTPGAVELKQSTASEAARGNTARAQKKKTDASALAEDSATTAKGDSEVKEKKQKKSKAKQKQEKNDKKQVELQQKIQDEKAKKKEKKEKKRKAKQEKQARKKAGIDAEEHVDADVAFDSDEIESDVDDDVFVDVSMFEAHGFVMIDLENELDELALIADMASGGGGRALPGKSKKQAASAKQAKLEGGAHSAGKQQLVEEESSSKVGEHVAAPLDKKKAKASKKEKKKLRTTASGDNATVPIEKLAKVVKGKADAERKPPAGTMDGNEKKNAAKKEKKEKKTKRGDPEGTTQGSPEKVETPKERGRRSRNASAKRIAGDSNSIVYEEYVDHDLVLKGLEDGSFFQGKLRVNNRYRMDGYVTVDGIPVDILVKGMSDRNRAFDGDLVAIRLHPESEWKPLNEDKDGARSAMEPIRSSPPLDKQKLHSLWLPSVETARCFIERPDDDHKHVVADNLSKLQINAITDKAAALRLRPTAKVVYILAHGNTQGFIGSLEPKTKPKDLDAPLSSDDAYAYFNAHDERLPRRIQIPRLQLPDEFVSHPVSYSQTMLCFCRVKSWSTKYKSPMGEFVKTVGEFSGIESGISAILTKHDLLSHTLDFESEILEDLDAKYGVSGEKWVIPDEEFQKRRDFRTYQIFSIDPYNARDLDDALHVRALNDERTRFEIGVHIADVTHFIEEGSLLDKEARERATSVYLANRVLPMLPRVLCEKLCSLQPQVDRLAFSVVWQMNADGTLVDGYEPWFGKSIIRSCCKLDYGSAQKMLDGAITSENVDQWEEDRRPIVGENPLITNASVIQSVRDLWSIGKCRREMRFDTGAISLNNVKIVFSLDAKGNPTTYGSYQLKDSNRLVEEYMLMANYLVAQQLLRAHGPLAFIRNHPQPIAQAMEQTLGLLQENQVELDGSSTKSLSESLEQVRIKFGETAFAIVQAMIIKPMKPAEYMVAGNGDSPEAWRHYALNIPYYTHFTSPIRRYADVVVHRLLQESVTCGELLPVEDPERDVAGLLQTFTEVAQNCNGKKTTAKNAETECDLVFLCAYVKHHGAAEVTGVVMSMGPQSFTVYIMELGLEERIFLKNAGLTGTWDEKASNLAIRLGSKANQPGKDANDVAKPIQLSFMRKLRLLMSVTEAIPLKLTFSVVDEKL